MFHATLTPLALIAFMLVTRPVPAADRLIDGVPLPEDAKVASLAATDPAALRQWAGVWVGAWGGTLKHILLVESVAADGSARVVYAIGESRIEVAHRVIGQRGKMDHAKIGVGGHSYGAFTTMLVAGVPRLVRVCSNEKGTADHAAPSATGNRL